MIRCPGTLVVACIMHVCALLFLCLSAREARADIPGPRSECETPPPSCVACWRPYSSDPSNQTFYAKCRDEALAKGYAEACQQRRGAGDQQYYCPKGVKVESRIVGGGCAGCQSVALSNPLADAAAVVLGLALAGVVARRIRTRVRRTE